LDNIIEQWKKLIETSENVSSRRFTLNSGFLAFHMSLSVAIVSKTFIATWPVVLLGSLFALIWLLLIRNSRKLNKAKFEIINQWERKYSNILEPCFSKEWEILTKDGYVSFSTLESYLPVYFIIIYLIFPFL